MNVRLGINPLTWSNDDMPSLGAEIPLETCLREARAAGYEGVELGHKFPRRAAELGAILADHGLALVSGWYSARLLERDVDSEFAAMQPHLELLIALGCEVMVVAEGTGNIHGDRAARLSQRPYMPRGRWEEYGARLTELAERMRGRGTAHGLTITTWVLWCSPRWTSTLSCPAPGPPSSCCSTPGT